MLENQFISLHIDVVCSRNFNPIQVHTRGELEFGRVNNNLMCSSILDCINQGLDGLTREIEYKQFYVAWFRPHSAAIKKTLSLILSSLQPHRKMLSGFSMTNMKHSPRNLEGSVLFC